MKIKLLVAAVAATSLAGCAGTDYKLYAESQTKIAMAQAMAEKARYEAMAEIGDSSDVARVAAVMAMQQQGASQSRGTQLQQPEDWSDKLYKWTVGLLPGVAQIYGIQKNTEVQLQASNNAKDIRINTNETMESMGNRGYEVVENIQIGRDVVVSDPTIVTDADGNETAVYPEVSRGE